MKILGGLTVAASLVVVLPSNALAQRVDVGLSGAALISIQPRDDAYIGSPYLNEGQGGIAPAWGGGLSAVTSGGLVVAGELTTAHFEMIQYGRLVGGSGQNEGAPHTSRWRSTLVNGLIGYATKPSPTRLVVLGGISKSFGIPTIDGRDYQTGDDEGYPLGFTGGLDLYRNFGSRSALVITSRYTFVERSETLRSLGIGPDTLRVGVGLRIRLNN